MTIRNHTKATPGICKPLVSALALGAALLAGPARAHHLWGQITADNPAVAKLAFADEPGVPSEDELIKRIETARAWSLDGKTLAMKTDAKERSGALTGQRVFAAEQYYGVLDKTDEGRGVFKLMYYAKSAASLEDAAAVAGLPLEMFARREGADDVIVTLKRGTQAYGQASISVFVPGEEKYRIVKTDAKGEIRFSAKAPGLYGLKASWVDETPGEIEGKKYPFVRNYSTLTFRIAGTPAAAPAAKPAQ